MPDKTLSEVFGDIADAIREKSGDSGTMTPLQMADNIANIPTGPDMNYETVNEFLGTETYSIYIYSYSGSESITPIQGQVWSGHWALESSGTPHEIYTYPSESGYYHYNSYGDEFTEADFPSEDGTYYFEGSFQKLQDGFYDISDGYPSNYMLEDHEGYRYTISSDAHGNSGLKALSDGLYMEEDNVLSEVGEESMYPLDKTKSYRLYYEDEAWNIEEITA